jgi:outer membrane receptor protein involved in Fe transport
VEYSNPISEDKKFESGYILESLESDMDLFRDTLNPETNIWDKDIVRSNRFVRTDLTHVLYATYEQEMDNFGFLAGLRAEQTYTKSDLSTKNIVYDGDYFRLYPTLHVTYKLSKLNEFQLNYSHRIRRPEDEELNPFPEYQNMKNIRAGNPFLKPEDIHSLELGYQFKKNSITFLSTVYYRYRYNGITTITKDIGNSVFYSTLENLSKNRSAGLELVFSTTLRKFANVNLSTNTFYNTIDASELGYSENKSNIAWIANGSVAINLTKSTVLQLMSNYSSETLTPQGKRLASYVLNAGFKQDLFKRKASMIITVSDIFNSLQSNSIIDTPNLYKKDMRRRSARLIYIGFSYSFGSASKKPKENNMKFDNQI